MVRCDNLLQRYPAQLSGGQQQRVALARGIVARPDLILFDEPLSNLDARLRKEVRAELHELHERLKFTAVYVTHDQDEAFGLADRIAILRGGKIEQLATPRDIYGSPNNEYVAEFIGMSNRLELVAVADGWRCSSGALHGEALEIDGRHDRLVIRTRPHELTIAPAGETPPLASNWIDASVVDVSYGGRSRDVFVQAGDDALQVHVKADQHDQHWTDQLGPGAQVTVGLVARTAAVFDEHGHRATNSGPVDVLRELETVDG
jgi:iron(III) transport system ATP-binding protein